MIFDALVAVCQGRFLNMQITSGRPGLPADRTITFPAAHPAVGDIAIWDDGDEATVAVGKITHGHFGCYDSGLSKEQMASRVAADVADFLEDLFADRILLWTALAGTAGGWRKVASRPLRAPRSILRRWFVWSGPLSK